MAKLLVFLVAFLVIIPLASLLARKNAYVQFGVFAWTVYFTSCYAQIHLLPIPDWTGSARGFAFSATDLGTSILLLSMVNLPQYKLRWLPPGAKLYWLYFGLTALSGINALYKLPWGFELLKMGWMYLLFVAIYNYLNMRRTLWPLVYIICFTLYIMLAVGVYQKYFGGIFQVRSTLPHQNSLCLYMTLYGGILLGILLNEKCSKMQFILVGAGVMCTALLILFSFSRGGQVGYALMCFLVVTLSLLLNGISFRKVAVIGAGAVALLVLVMVALPRIVYRFQNAPKESASTRVYLNRAAVRIANDYFFGIGANNFSAYSGPFQDYAFEQNENLRITEDTSEFGAIVEMVYLLIAAECGWITLGVYLLWLLGFWLKSWRCAWQLRKKAGFGLSVGLFAGLSCNYFQSLLEWVLRQYSNFYQLMIVFALVAVIADNLFYMLKSDNSNAPQTVK